MNSFGFVIGAEGISDMEGEDAIDSGGDWGGTNACVSAATTSGGVSHLRNTGPVDDGLTIACAGARIAQALARHRRESILRGPVMRLRQ